MTNKIALIFAFIIIATFVADYFFFHWDLHVSLGKRLVQLSEYIAFWR